jgi:predicted ATPase
MHRHNLTGAPGAGKTTVLRALAARGFAVVEESATDIIAREQSAGVSEPWAEARFINDILALQCERIAAIRAPVQFHDRSPICTLALARFLGHPVSRGLTAELGRIVEQGIFQNRVFFIDSLGFVEPTAARRISFAESLDFERLHEQTYRHLGFECLHIAAGPAGKRVGKILAAL